MVDRRGVGRRYWNGGLMYHPPPICLTLMLVFEIHDFLQECGGIYQNKTARVEENLILCISTGQFLWKKGEYFVGYWKVNKGDIDGLFEEIRPSDICSGSSMYVVECGCKNRKGMVEIVRKLRKAGKGLKGVYWNREGKTPKLFPRQEGA
jgi:hypothetical protein